MHKTMLSHIPSNSSGHTQSYT